MAKLYYDLPDVSLNFVDQNKVPNTYSLRAVRAFLYYIVEDQKLTIAEYLAMMGNDPFFLLAATGLGKTVAAPVHVYLKNCEQVLASLKNSKKVLLERRNVPRVWVVEPKISIAEDQERFMNSLFATFISSRNNPKDPKNPVFFGCKTSNRDSNYFAPIKFITTGIFAIAARLGWINPELDSVIIDEAHVTIESDEGVELGIAICRQKRIPVHYMSATVDTQNLMETLEVGNIIEANKQRFPIWMHNTHLSLENCIVDLVENTLVYPDVDSEYFPQGRDNVSRSIRNAVLEEDRAKGLLIVVNSFAGENSDARKIAELLTESHYGNEIEVLLLASAVIRNFAAKQKFDRQMEAIEKEKRKYVIIATSVVEMGITFPTLDFIVTMDSGYENVTIGDSVLSDMVPLGVNSLKQRIGRVGRKRPGIGYITSEVDAYYSDLDDYELNGDGLIYEPVKLPMTNGTLTTLAYYSFVQKWEDVFLELDALNLPSKVQYSEERMERLFHERDRLIEAGVAVDNELTPEGMYCERWMGVADIGYAVKVQQALSAGSREDIIFYLVAAALSEVALHNLYARQEEPIPERLSSTETVTYVFEPEASMPLDESDDNQEFDWDSEWENVYDKFVDDDGFDFVIRPDDNPKSLPEQKPDSLPEEENSDAHSTTQEETWGIRTEDGEIEYSPLSDLITLYNIVSYFANKYGISLLGVTKNPSIVFESYRSALNRDCESLGFNAESIFGLLKGLKDIFKTFVETNKKRDEFKALFGEVQTLGFEELMPQQLDKWSVMFHLAILRNFPGRVTIALEEIREQEFTWVEIEGTRDGVIKQGQTSVVLSDGIKLTAKLVPEPGNATRKAGESWKVVHPQAIEGDFV